MRVIESVLVGAALGVMMIGTGGCGSGGQPGTVEQTGDQDQAAHEVADHSGWWCVEHGIPEDDCAMCNSRLAAEHREKGDWCDEHHRPESQCFICSPEKAETYAALYEAKYGETPPPWTD